MANTLKKAKPEVTRGKHSWLDEYTFGKNEKKWKLLIAQEVIIFSIFGYLFLSGCVTSRFRRLNISPNFLSCIKASPETVFGPLRSLVHLSESSANQIFAALMAVVLYVAFPFFGYIMLKFMRKNREGMARTKQGPAGKEQRMRSHWNFRRGLRWSAIVLAISAVSTLLVVWLIGIFSASFQHMSQVPVWLTIVLLLIALASSAMAVIPARYFAKTTNPILNVGIFALLYLLCLIFIFLLSIATFQIIYAV